MKILAIDYGDVRTGFAVSDVTETIASPIGTFVCETMRKAVDKTLELISKTGAQKVVIGLPINMDGSEGERASKTRSFATVIERVSGLAVEFRDERLTTVSAERSLIESGVRREKRKQVIDTVSAQIILQSYLDIKKSKF